MPISFGGQRAEEEERQDAGHQRLGLAVVAGAISRDAARPDDEQHDAATKAAVSSER